MTEAVLFNIQRFCLHDGDGIRTVFFFKGCPLRCKWCHNPEGQTKETQRVFRPDRCRRCDSCAGDGCVYGAEEVAGRAYTPQELISVAERDTAFYQSSGGGVTLSGGEVMTQPPDFLLPFMRGLKQKGFHIVIDTCGHAPFEAFEAVLPYTDQFLYDIKLIDRERHIEFTGQDNDLILSNLGKLSEKGAALEIRVPVIEGVNADEESMDAIIRHIGGKRVRFLPYHALSGEKYRSLGMEPEGAFSAPSAGRMADIIIKCAQMGVEPL